MSVSSSPRLPIPGDDDLIPEREPTVSLTEDAAASLEHFLGEQQRAGHLPTSWEPSELLICFDALLVAESGHRGKSGV